MRFDRKRLVLNQRAANIARDREITRLVGLLSRSGNRIL
jgi:hypothetical protein